MSLTETLIRHLRRPPSVYLRRARQKLAQISREPIYINGLYKSGSTFIYENLAHGLFRESALPLSRFDVLMPDRLEKMLRDRTVVHDHMPATPHNLSCLNGNLEKLVVQVRDPRQSVLSWMMDQEKKNPSFSDGSEMAFYLHDLIPDYFNLSLSAKIDLHLKFRMKHTVDWIDGWLDASEDENFAPVILFNRQEDLKGASRPVFEKILDFYEIDHALFDFPEPPKPGRHSFRKGDSNEWRSVFTDEQKEFATSMIPDRLFENFD